jgi:hypothetical protein
VVSAIATSQGVATKPSMRDDAAVSMTYGCVKWSDTDATSRSSGDTSPSARTNAAGIGRIRGARRPTANLSPESEGLIPEDGVYAGWLTDEGVRYPAAISVGNNPTFEGVPQKQVEAYVLDEDIDLYDHRVEIAFVERIRGMVAFAGIDPLIAQIAADVEQARAILS